MDGYITIGTELDTKKFDAQILQLERKANDLEKILSNPKDVGLSEEELQQVQVELEKTKNKIISLRKEKEKLENTQNTKQLTEGINNLGNSFEKSIAKAGRLALSIFGIRSAYMALKRASSDLASYDEQYATNLEYIRFVLTQAIAPVLKGIVQLAMQLLSYINAITQAWFGINLFANGSAEQFKKMKSQAGGVSKEVKEIKKQLTGFDEINILSDKSDTGTSAGAGEVTMPSMDLSTMQAEPPKWMQWILDHKNEIIAGLAGILGGLTALKLGLGGLTSLGIGAVISGIVYSVMSLLEYIKDPSWKNFGSIIQGIGVAIIGVGVLIGAWPVAIAGAGALIVGTIIKYWDNIKAFFQRGIDWLKSKSDWIRNGLGDFIGDIYDAVVRMLQKVLNFFDSIIKAIKRIFDGFIEFFKGAFTGNWKQAWEGIKNIFGGIIDFVKAKLQLMINFIDETLIKPLVKWFDDLWNNTKKGATDAWNGIKSVFSNVAGFFKDIFTKAWTAVKLVFSTGGKIFDGIKEGIVTAFKNIVNGIITGINKVISVPFNTLNTVLNKIKNISIAGVKPFNWVWTVSVPQIPKLKSGGIINMPNTGTLLNGMAIGGESGAEGVIPLTDSQAMAELGRQIGKNVVINTSIINKMNSRVISREMVRTQNQENFAFNA